MQRWEPCGVLCLFVPVNFIGLENDHCMHSFLSARLSIRDDSNGCIVRPVWVEITWWGLPNHWFIR